MIKTILVIGSVTAKQYRDIRLNYLREGHKPLIMRVRDWEEIDLDGMELIRLYGSEDGSELPYQSPMWNEMFYSEDEELMKRLMKKHLEQFGDIAAIIMPNEVYEEVAGNGADPFVSYADGFCKDVPIWRVHGWGYIELVP
ncbi:MAG TPA: hypothetical protein PLN95_01560 [Candidatus Saccharibacteria bacterium]|nr:hypothetical protein [Candidatus Saccharibacteria bacterium]